MKALSSINVRPGLAIACGIIAVTLLWSYFGGKDLNFDQLSYHFYLPFHLLNDRLGHDFLAASGQSYLNPFPYVPFYWMVMQDWHSLLIASLLASAHSVNIVLAYRIGKHALGHHRHGTWLALLGAVLAFLSPVFLMEVGTSFADITTCIFVATAVLMLLHARSDAPAWRHPVVLAGLCLGVAAGLKLSNAVFAPALFAMLLCMRPSLKPLVKLSLLFAAGSLAGFLLANGYWGWRLWQEFGNPFFPLFSTLFPSPDYPQLGGAHQRFLPDSWTDYLTRPFAMMRLRSWIHIESVSPDLRLAALSCSLLAILAAALWRYRSTGEPILARPALALLAFMICGYILWMATSGNSRYGLVLSILCGPALACIAPTLLTSRAAIASLAVLAALQLLHLQNGDLRWMTGQWTRTWYEPVISDQLKSNDYLYVSVGMNANSYVYPFLSPGSAFTNPIGQTPIDLEGPGGRRIKSLLDSYRGRTLLMSTISEEDEASGLSDWNSAMDALVSRLHLSLDTADCEDIQTAGGFVKSRQEVDATKSNVQRIRTCALRPRDFALAAERARLQAIVNQVVAWCPTLFQPSYAVLERQPGSWSAHFVSTDVNLFIFDQTLIASPVRAKVNYHLGHLDDWNAGRRPDCASFPPKPPTN